MAASYPAGYIGFAVSYPFLYLFGFWASLLIFFVIVLIAVSVAFNVPLFHKKEDEEAEEDDALETKEDLDARWHTSLKNSWHKNLIDIL